MRALFTAVAHVALAAILGITSNTRAPYHGPPAVYQGQPVATWTDGHPINLGGFVMDGSPQRGDRWCVGSAYQIGACLSARRGPGVFACLQVIVNREDPGWDPTRWNQGGSGAYGLPQALPGAKMAAAGADWATSARTQLVWLLDDYSPAVYGGICPAAAHEQTYGTY